MVYCKRFLSIHPSIYLSIWSVCVCRSVSWTLSVEEGCAVPWVCGLAAWECAQLWDRRETTVTPWATRWTLHVFSPTGVIYHWSDMDIRHIIEKNEPLHSGPNRRAAAPHFSEVLMVDWIFLFFSFLSLQVPFFGKRLHHSCPCLPNLSCIATDKGRHKCVSPVSDYFFWVTPPIGLMKTRELF